MKEATQTTDFHQQLMNDAYSTFKNDMRYEDWFNTLDELHQQAVMVGNVNYQVGNGGWSQLHYNYMPGNGCNGSWNESNKEMFLKLMYSLGTANCERVADMFEAVWDAEEEEIEDEVEYEDENGEIQVEYEVVDHEYPYFEELDTMFYSFNEEWMKEFNQYFESHMQKVSN